MANCIIGTAGHVDHGKTCLIKALTGIDTDRLAEEKARGITIELGFAHLTLPDSRTVGIVDVPGHERFIKNMLSGAGGIDIAMLIVAADEGIMPQTTEHLNILRLLDIKRGFVVVTKADLVEPDWLEMVIEQVAEAVEGTFLQGTPVIPASAYTGEGIEQIKQTIFELAQAIGEKDSLRPFRLPVDRVFSMEGHGSVVTGTLIEGSIKMGDEVMLYPQQKRVKVRNLQVHSQYTPTAFVGARTAVNITGAKKSDISRGDVLALPGSLQNTMMVDAFLQVLPGCGREVKSGNRLHLYLGAREVLCKAALLDCAALEPSSGGFVQLRTEEEIACKPGDRFVVRFYSPMETIGGGVIVDACPKKHKLFAGAPNDYLLRALAVKKDGDKTRALEQYMRECSADCFTIDQYALRMGEPASALESPMEELTNSGRALNIAKVSLHKDYVDKIQADLQSVLAEYHKRLPLLFGMKRQELVSKVMPKLDGALRDGLLQYYIDNNAIKQGEGVIALYDFEIVFSPAQRALAELVIADYKAGGFSPPTTDDVLLKYAKQGDCAQVLQSLCEQRVLVKLDDQTTLHADCFNAALELLKEGIERQGSLTLAEFRDILQTSRKYAAAFLEYLDRQGVTKKTGDARILRRGS